MILKYIVAYLIFSYFVNLIITAYLFKYKSSALFKGSIKKDLSPLTIFAIFWGFSPIMLPLVIIIYILNYFKDKVVK